MRRDDPTEGEEPPAVKEEDGGFSLTWLRVGLILALCPESQPDVTLGLFWPMAPFWAWFVGSLK